MGMVEMKSGLEGGNVLDSEFIKLNFEIWDFIVMGGRAPRYGRWSILGD